MGSPGAWAGQALCVADRSEAKCTPHPHHRHHRHHHHHPPETLKSVAPFILNLLPLADTRHPS